jgi:DNA-binding MarR family transcriptional regulator
MARVKGPPDTAAFLLSKVGFDVSRGFGKRLAPLGLEPRHVGLLRNIMTAEGQSQRALGEALHIPASRMVALVDELEERDLVERRPDPEDRRVCAIHLTPHGRQLMGKVAKIGMEHEAAVTAGLSAKEREQLIELLRKLASEQDMPISVHPGLRG